MKNLFSVLTVAAVILTIIFVVAHLRFTPSAMPEEIDKTPVPAADAKTVAGSAQRSVDAEVIKQFNLFSPARGQKVDSNENDKETEQQRKNPDFELIGIGVFDDECGAVIKIKGIDNKKRYFREGDEIGTDYTVSSISRAGVILTGRRGDRIDLKLANKNISVQMTPEDSKKLGNMVFTINSEAKPKDEAVNDI